MKCLSLWQPWATLIAIGAKRIETRHWSTSYRGPLLIHAAKKWDRELSEMCCDEPFNSALRKNGTTCADAHAWGLPRGYIIAVVDLINCQEVKRTHVKAVDHSSTSGSYVLSAALADGKIVAGNEHEFGDYTVGRFAWMLANIRRFETPVPCVGHQQIFNVPDATVADQLAKAQVIA